MVVRKCWAGKLRVSNEAASFNFVAQGDGNEDLSLLWLGALLVLFVCSQAGDITSYITRILDEYRYISLSKVVETKFAPRRAW